MTLPKNIVIIEDEVITQRYLQDILSQYEITVSVCFDNAKDTLERLRDVPCDLLLMDINIKGSMDGIQLAREILRTSTLPIVFISAHSDDETLEELLELAPYGFIEKPFTSKEIMVTIQIAYKRYITHKEMSNKGNISVKKEILLINKMHKYNYSTSTLFVEDNPISLTYTQGKLLSILVKNINKTVTYDTLIMEIWSDTNIADSALRTLVYALRKIVPNLPLVLQSKVGYMLRTEEVEGGND